MPEAVAAPVVITPEAFLAHWQAHRRLTRRVITAFPADEFASLTIGGMRPFAALAKEILGMAVPTVGGIVMGNWDEYKESTATTRDEILAEWDATTAELERLFPQIPLAKFGETVTAFGQWTMPVHDLLFYVIDNEVHHRAQGYVYLRALGVEPPAFWDRS